MQGPFPADTIFLKAQAGEFRPSSPCITIQGQIAIKLLGFARRDGAGRAAHSHHHARHGTAYDIAGQGRASDAMWQAFNVACRMGRSHRAAPPA